MTRFVAVIGGGPAGLMAAEVLATADADVAVTVFDRMPSVGRKLQLAGRGGLNLTHTESIEAFLDRYGEARTRLEPAIRAFDPAALRQWSGGLGQRAVVGTSGRVFPEALRSTPLLRAWIQRLEGLGVEFRLRHIWRGWGAGGALAFDGREPFAAAATILALGGASWPRTGSDGGWVEPVAGAGIAIAPLRPANGGFLVQWTELFRQRFGGTPLKNIALTHGGRCVRGEVMVTATGIEGGAVYGLGRSIRTAIEVTGGAVVHLDLRPDIPLDEMAGRIGRGGRPKDSRSTTLRRVAGLTPTAVALLRETGGVGLTAGPDELAAHIKGVPLALVGTQPIARAISTAGGIAFDEIDGDFMLWRRPGTFVAGEMIDWEAPTGGYLLQASFATGVAAARGVLARLASEA